MAKVLCVLYADPVDGYPTGYPRDDLPKLERYPGRADAADAQGRSTSSRAPCSAASRASWACRPCLEANGHTLVVTADKDGAGFGARARAGRRRHRHLAALLAGLSDRRADRQGEEPQDDRHRRHRLRPYRPPGGDRARRHRHRGDLLQLDLGRRACGDDDPRAGAQLSALAPGGAATAAGTSPIARPAPTTSRACMSAPSRPGGSGSAVLRRLKPFDMHLHYYDRHRLPGRGGSGAGPDLARQRRGHGRRCATW